ncbi:MAG: glucose-6-phosphate isomerase [Sedimentisphaerales bacterium]|nr:glucose-6-phosphate isomerase [Sedimentisphaerales bacterium]
MAEQITLYYKHALSQIGNPEHGLSIDEINRLGDKIAQITTKMNKDRQAGKLPYRDLPYEDLIRRRVTDLAGKLKGKYETMMVLGIGGSALGNIALQTSLNSPMYNLLPDSKRPGPRLFIIDNVDPVQFGSLLDYLESRLDKTLFNVISKSGRTAETAAQFLTVQEMLRKKLPNAKLTDHIVATTDAKSGTMRGIVQKEGFASLEVPDGVGGRFSVLSDVGLFSAAMCGVDIEALHEGARDMDQRVKKADLMENPAALYAAIQYLFYQKGKPLSVMMPYSYQLKDLCDWYRQLWAESLGKEKDLQGKVVHVGPTPIKALGATDQHSQVQLYREGPNDKVFTFLEVEDFGQEVTIGSAGQVEELSYLSGQPMSKLINSEKHGTEYALLQSKRPCLTVRFPAINAYTVGQFIYLFEVATSYMGELLDINTYDQPAVELGKEATFALMGQEKYQLLKQKIQPVCDIDNNFLI